jgi:DTW domain-containing protein YfiP
MARPFSVSADLMLIAHPEEVASTVGTAWILRRSISNLQWIRSTGDDLDQNPAFLERVRTPHYSPLLLFPGQRALNLNRATQQEWQQIVPSGTRPLFIVIDGSWGQARAILRKSSILKTFPRVSFEASRLSEYQFKKQPHPACLSSVEGVHRLMEVLASRGWAHLPKAREHDQMIEIFRTMIRFQLEQEKTYQERRKLKLEVV